MQRKKMKLIIAWIKELYLLADADFYFWRHRQEEYLENMII